MGKRFLPMLLLAGFLGAGGWYVLQTEFGAQVGDTLSELSSADLLPGSTVAGDRQQVRAAPSSTKLIPEGPDLAHRTTPAFNPDAIRNVSPEGVSVPRVTGDLVRIAPKLPKPLIRMSKNPELPDGSFSIPLPEVMSASILKADDFFIRLANVAPMKTNETCRTPAGVAWPCGMRARTALRGFVRRYALTCERLGKDKLDRVIATCSRNGQDLSQWLLKTGWGRAEADAPSEYLDLAKAAQAQEIGLWRKDAPAVQEANNDMRLDAEPDLQRPTPEEQENLDTQPLLSEVTGLEEADALARRMALPGFPSSAAEDFAFGAQNSDQGSGQSPASGLTAESGPSR